MNKNSKLVQTPFKTEPEGPWTAPEEQAPEEQAPEKAKRGRPKKEPSKPTYNQLEKMHLEQKQKLLEQKQLIAAVIDAQHDYSAKTWSTIERGAIELVEAQGKALKSTMTAKVAMGLFGVAVALELVIVLKSFGAL